MTVFDPVRAAFDAYQAALFEETPQSVVAWDELTERAKEAWSLAVGVAVNRHWRDELEVQQAPARRGPRQWVEADFAQLDADDPPTTKTPDTDLMCGRVRTWVWRVRDDLTVTRVWRETAERGQWVEAKP